MKALVGLLLGLLGAVASAQTLFGNDKQAFALMPSEVISSGIVLNVDISRNGHLVRYDKLPFPSLQQSLLPDTSKSETYIYNRKTKVSKRISLPGKPARLEMFGDDRHVFYETIESGMGFVDLANGTTQPIQIKNVNLNYFGSTDGAYFLTGISEANDLVLYFPDGSVWSAKVPQGMTISGPLDVSQESFNFLGYRKNGKKSDFYNVSFSRSTTLSKERLLSGEEFDHIMSHGPFADVQSFTWDKTGDDGYILLDSEIETVTPSVGVAAPAKVDKPTHNFIPEKAKIGPAEGGVHISDRGQFVLYHDAGSLLVREIMPIDAELAKKLSLEDIKAKLISRAKTVGLGFMIYAADYDDVYPGAEGWENKILPYIKDRDTMKDFNYSFRGGDVNKIEDPSKTELGFLVGPGGRAVVYLDGSAKWIPNP